MFEVLVSFLVSCLISGGLYLGIKKNRDNSNQISEVLNKLNNFENTLYDLKSEINALIHMNEAEELVSLIKEYNSILLHEKSKLNISSIEQVSLENRLREFTDIEQELESSSLETRDILKSFNTNWDSIAASCKSLSEKEAIWKESLQNLGNQTELENVDQLFSDVIKEINLFEPIFNNSLEVIRNLKTRFDALDIEFAELFERFGELEV